MMAAAKNELHWVREKAGAVQKVYNTAGGLLGYIRLNKTHPLGPTFEIKRVNGGDIKHVGSCGGGTRDDAQTRAREFLESIIKAEG